METKQIVEHLVQPAPAGAKGVSNHDMLVGIGFFVGSLALIEAFAPTPLHNITAEDRIKLALTVGVGIFLGLKVIDVLRNQ